ncbi:MAG: tRNA glutamyl-Q(34) synthetase GluQRS [Mariprofundaceae bacterium]
MILNILDHKMNALGRESALGYNPLHPDLSRAFLTLRTESLKLKTRFAPSPTGLLHVGNAYSALICQKWAEKHHADLLLRIEDIDYTRCKPEFYQQITDDLEWLGISFHGETIKQSDRHGLYRSALEKLQSLGVIYPCFCTRKHIQQEIERMGIAPHAEDIIDPYPGICREIDRHQSRSRMEHERFAWRLNTAKAMEMVGESLTWCDQSGRHHPVTLSSLGDMVIGRKDIDFSYHLTVVVDDADQDITHIIRGEDLLPSTAIHRLLQALLNLPSPTYIHHALISDSDGRRLAKRNRVITLKSLREAGCNPELLCKYLLGSEGLIWPFQEHEISTIPERLTEQLGSHV